MSTSGFRTKQPNEATRPNVCTSAEAEVERYLADLLGDVSNNGAFQGAGYEAALAASLPPRDIEIAADEYEELETLRRAGAL
jgi:hypothetical protein